MDTNRKFFDNIQAGKLHYYDPGHATGSPVTLVRHTADWRVQPLGPTQANGAGTGSTRDFVPKASEAPINLDPEPQNSVPASRRGSGISFALPPTEEDLTRMLSTLTRTGYIRGLCNAHTVWSYIHRDAVEKSYPNASLADISIHLGNEWAKLSLEHRRPYYQAAIKLKVMLMQQFPQYEYHLQRKRGRQNLISGNVAVQAASQAAGQQRVPYPSFSSTQAMPPSQSKLIYPSMYPVHSIVPYPVGCYPWPLFYQHHSMGLHSCAHRPRLFHRHPNPCSFVHGVINHHHGYLQRGTMAPTAVTRMQQNLYPCDVSQQVCSGSTATSGNLREPGFVPTGELSSNSEMNSVFDEDIDVVGL